VTASLGDWRGVKFRPAYAIMRAHPRSLDKPSSREHLEAMAHAAICPVRILWSMEVAEREATRLNEVNEDKAYYFVVQVRVEDDRTPACGS
jgi:hypothetical protein